MKIISTKLWHNNMVFQYKINKTEMGLMSHFRFNCLSNNVMLRIQKDGNLIGCVHGGNYFTAFTSSSPLLKNTDSKGLWEFTVFLLKAEGETLVDVEFIQEKMVDKVFYGDLHSHSICSTDAVNTFEEIEKEVVRQGNDFHAVTDHNSYAMNLQYGNKTSNVEFIYGVEMTNGFGHYNFLGKEIPVDECLVKGEEDFIEKILNHKKNGGYVTFNHPFSPKSRVCKLPITKEYCDFVEIWNGPWAIHNKIALKWWNNKLIEKIYFPICGGSDTHNLKDERYYGNPTNCIIAPFNEQQILLRQLKKGHSYILGKQNIIDVEFQDTIFGDTIEKSSFEIKFTAKENYNLHIISNNHTIVKSINDVSGKFSMEDQLFIRFEAYDKNNNCVFISNPIFSPSFWL